MNIIINNKVTPWHLTSKLKFITLPSDKNVPFRKKITKTKLKRSTHELAAHIHCFSLKSFFSRGNDAQGVAFTTQELLWLYFSSSSYHLKVMSKKLNQSGLIKIISRIFN